MKDTELVAALRQLKVNTKSIACLGCGHENGCSTHGCRLIGIAADTIATYDSAIESIEKMYSAANGVGKSYLRDVLKLFHIYMPPFPEPLHMVYDFEVCNDKYELATVMRNINTLGYSLFAVTHEKGMYTVFFRRPASE